MGIKTALLARLAKKTPMVLTVRFLLVSYCEEKRVLNFDSKFFFCCIFDFTKCFFSFSDFIGVFISQMVDVNLPYLYVKDIKMLHTYTENRTPRRIPENLKNRNS
jgi:hypothetical protein